MTKLVLGSLMIASSIASAEPSLTAHADDSPGYIALGGQIDSTLAFDTGITLDAGYRIGSSPWFVHGQLGRGDTSDLSEAVGGSTMSFYRGDSRWTRLRAGIEKQACTSSGIVCGIAGVDVGVLHAGATTGPYSDTPSATYTNELVTPSIGIDVGGRHLRLRTMLGLDVGVAQRTTMDGVTTTQAAGGFDVGAGVVYRF